jgi:hypothetical protein
MSSQAATFYADQADLTQEAINDVDESLADTSEEAVAPDDIPLLSQARQELVDMKATLQSQGAFVTGVAIDLPTARLNALLALPNQIVKTIQFLTGEDNGRAALERVSSNAELLPVATTASSSRATSSDSTATNSQPTCSDADQGTKTKSFHSEYFMPNNWRFKTRLFGVPDSQGLFQKLNKVAMIWRQTGVLSWFCGDDDHDRGFEPETGVSHEMPRWSTDQIDDKWQSNLPSPYLDDLACGRPSEGDCPQPFAKERFPNFAVGTANGKALRYRKYYFTSNRTNRGETNQGTVIVRGQQTTRPSSLGERGYCVGRGLSRSSCYFGDGTYCIRTIPIENRVRARNVATWPRDPLCNQ